MSASRHVMNCIAAYLIVRRKLQDPERPARSPRQKQFLHWKGSPLARIATDPRLTMHLSRRRGLLYAGLSCVIGQSNTMTFQQEAEMRRPSVGTKVLMVGFAVLAVLGSFWTIVWFIRAYVEAPRVGIPAAIALAARESEPVVPAAPTTRPASTMADPQAAIPPTAPAAEQARPAQAQAETAASGAIADRWLPTIPPPSPSAEPIPAVASPAPAALAITSDNEPTLEEVAESSVPT